MTFLICRISPRTSTAIFCVKSPLAMAVATLDMSRSCTVRLDAMGLSLSVRSYLVSNTPLSCSEPLLLLGEVMELIHYFVDVVLQFEKFAADIHIDFLRQMSIRYRCFHCRDVAHLRREVRCHEIDVVGQIFPGARDSFDFCLTAQLSF